ncbi:MAG TPA: hypothetical protein PLQ56_20145 [Aggregatilineales bacterium]|nr:hypothetical protein [Aggregatilineales bacterium]
MSLLISVLLLTYSGRMESSDTRAMLDAISSQFYFGDNLLDQTAYYTFPPPESNTGALAPVDVEPLQLILATPLFWLADKVPGFGLAHTVWLFNIFMTATAALVLYAYALRLGYDVRVGVVAGLTLAFCTILWPYSKTFFREPLALLLILLTGYALETARQFARYRLGWLLIALLAASGAWLTKEAIVFALPALLLIALPLRLPNRVHGLLLGLLLLPLVLLIALTAISLFADISAWFEPLYRWLAELTNRPLAQVNVILTASHAYLLSIGGSIWGTSPILLLALPGMFLLWKRGHRRYVFVAWIMLLGFVGGYALFRGTDWFGGLSWPPRFLVPVVPFLMLTTLPVWQYLLQRGRRYQWLLVILVLLYSIWIQLNAVSLPWERYNTALPAESGGLGEWGGGLNVIAYLRWWIIPALWSNHQLDFAWIRVSSPFWAFLLLLLAISSAWQLIIAMRVNNRSRWWVVLPWAVAVLIAIGLRSIYFDPLYLGDRPSLHAFLPQLQASTHPDDVVMLDNERYAPFFMNYGKLTHPRIVTLSDPPGESPSPEQPARVQSAIPDELIAQYTAPMIHKLAAQYERLWLLADSSQWLPWRVRPVERFMSRYFYPVQELSTTPPDPEIRLIEYSLENAPDPVEFRGPEQLTNFQFGDSIQLVGFSLPQGQTYLPGSVLNLSMYWMTQQPVDRNYTVAWFLVDIAQTRIVQGLDTPPVWGFAPTSEWNQGALVIDNRGLRLPLDLPVGEYQIWLRLYESGAPDKVLPVRGGNSMDEVTAVLSESLVVEMPVQP